MFQGIIPNFILIADDMTESQQNHDQLQMYRQQAILDHVPALIAYIDRNQRCQFMNRSFQSWHCLSATETMGRHIREIIGIQAYQTIAPYVEAALAGQAQAFEGLVPYQYGGGRYVRAKYLPHTNPAGHVQGFVAVVEDLTEHKRVEDALQQSEALNRSIEAQLRQAQKMEALGTFAGGIAHDFNNILGVIQGFAELTVRHTALDAEADRFLQEILIATRRARDLVQHLLTFSRKRAAERQPLHLPQVVYEVLSLLRASLPSTIAIAQHIAPDVGLVLADPTQMHQVLMNLCANAGYAMRDTGGVLEIRVETLVVDKAFADPYPALQSGPYVRLLIRDTGHGMTPEVMARIFEPFFTTKPPEEGTGLGLAVVQGIITNHRGVVTVESTPSQGTTFQVYFPQIPPVSTQEERPDNRVPHGTERILFVDDEEALARATRGTLEGLGYQVLTCTSSPEALATFTTTPQAFDLVITDQTMPAMTGEQLIYAMRRLRADIPIILCTGFSHTMDASKARAIGCNAFLKKPWTRSDLAQVVHYVLTSRPTSVLS